MVARFQGEPLNDNDAGDLADLALAAARADERQMLERAKREPLPKSRAAFKRHSGYVLESQLRQQEMVHPPEAKPVGLFQGKEPIWRRADIVELRTQMQWIRAGRVVRDGERAKKTLRTGEGRTFKAVKLFGFWQTDLAPEVPTGEVAESFQSGPIPGTNNYGNIELLESLGPAAAARLAPGTVHVPEMEARAAATKLGLPFAPAVVGFIMDRGQMKPRYEGAVIWQMTWLKWTQRSWWSGGDWRNCRSERRRSACRVRGSFLSRTRWWPSTSTRRMGSPSRGRWPR